VLSGSDDGNIRIWKARADEKLGIITARERAAMEYRDALKDRWRHDKQVDKVSRYVSAFFPPVVHQSLTHENY
jgi:WD repeat and SOF domain-containing protein 1